jgi:hypothetical protein
VIGFLAIGVGLALLALVSSLVVDAEGFAVRFFSLRWKRITWSRLAKAEYWMSFPSLALGITMTETGGRRARLHFGYWADEDRLVALVTARLLEVAPEMDAETAQIVSLATGTPARTATLRRIPWLERRRGRPLADPRPSETSWVGLVVAYLVITVVVIIGILGRGDHLIAAAMAFVAGGAAAGLAPIDTKMDARVGTVIFVAALLVPFAVLAPLIRGASTAYPLGFMGWFLLVRLVARGS